jgi:hypothetical protein
MPDVTHYPWWAIIGPVPTVPAGGFLLTPHDQTRRLMGKPQVGPLRLRGGEKALVEWLTCEPYTLFGVTKFVSWPIIVEGDEGDERGTAGHRHASGLVHRLACLLSIAWDEPWQERCTPQSPRNQSPQIPESWPPPPLWHGPSQPERLPVDVPLASWTARAWEAMETDEGLAAMASFWHQGLLASPRHPSFAAVAYTATIERAAAWLANRGDIPAPAGSLSRCVGTAIALVASDEEAKILGPLYKIRSGTAHGGRLHGTEIATGTFFTLRYEPGDAGSGKRPVLQSDLTDPLQLFTRRLQTARQISRRLIMRSLDVQ